MRNLTVDRFLKCLTQYLNLRAHCAHADSRLLYAGNIAVIMVMLLHLLSSNRKRHYVLS